MTEFYRVTAQDVRQQEFNRQMRGYDRAEVDDFLTNIADTLEKEAQEKEELKDKIELLERQLGEFRNLEKTLKNTLLTTQKAVDDIKHNALKESELIVREAQSKADQMQADLRGQIADLRSEFETVRAARDEYFIKFKNLLTSHLAMLNSMDSDYRTLEDRYETRKPDTSPSMGLGSDQKGSQP